MAEDLPRSISSINSSNNNRPATIPPETAEDEAKEFKPFPFLSLPPEVRNRIYECCLCPTQILSLTRTKSSRYATSPTRIPQLLCTNKKIYSECGQQQSYLFTNEICLSLDAHDTSWPIISETRLPQHVLERLEKVCMIFDVTGNFRATYKEDVDFDALTALTNLKMLRLGVVFDESSGYPEEFLGELMEEILVRLPRDVEVVCGIEVGSEQGEFLEGVLERRRVGRRIPEAVNAMEKEKLEAAVAGVEGSMRGSKNGGVQDVFAAYRMEPSSVGRRFQRQSDFAV